jgi:hypothetical protein
MAARLTIAIPTYNRSRLLRRALDSALAQTSAEVEILVSDNGSDDDTPALLARYRDPRLRCVRRAVTVPRARHGTLIFAEIDTEFVLVLSDDDYIEPDFCSEVLRLFDARPDLSFTYTGCIEHYDDQELPALVGPRVEGTLEFLDGYYQGRRQVSWCACVTRVADIRRIGPQPPDRICGDMFFWTRIAFQGPVGCVARALAHYTVLMPGGDNESRTTPILAWAKDVSRLADEVLQRVAGGAPPAGYVGALRAHVRQHLARSIANQFLWARIHGMSHAACLRLVPQALGVIRWSIPSLARVFAACLLSRRALRRLVLGGIARMAGQRQRQ